MYKRRRKKPNVRLCKSLEEKEKKRRLGKCLLLLLLVLLVVVLITTLKIGRASAHIHTRSCRFCCLIFDTENVSSWSVSILLTSSVVEYQHEEKNDDDNDNDDDN